MKKNIFLHCVDSLVHFIYNCFKVATARCLDAVSTKRGRLEMHRKVKPAESPAVRHALQGCNLLMPQRKASVYLLILTSKLVHGAPGCHATRLPRVTKHSEHF